MCKLCTHAQPINVQIMHGITSGQSNMQNLHNRGSCKICVYHFLK